MILLPWPPLRARRGSGRSRWASGVLVRTIGEAGLGVDVTMRPGACGSGRPMLRWAGVGSAAGHAGLRLAVSIIGFRYNARTDAVYNGHCSAQAVTARRTRMCGRYASCAASRGGTMTGRRRTILFLIADTGAGHRSAANAIIRAMAELQQQRQAPASHGQHP